MDYKKYRCFPSTYAEGRDWFTEAVAKQSGKHERFVHPEAKGPASSELSTDIGWFGPENAEKLFISISGTHGQEYFAGTATQLSWLASDGPQQLPDDVAVCLVHAHNPYGAAHFSRGNENFVDLNRNYQTFENPVRPNPLYQKLFDILFTSDLNDHLLDDVMANYHKFMESEDGKAAMTAMGGGQDTHPSGTIYCGTNQEWSTKTLRRIIDKYCSKAKTVALIDWHTGLGEHGEFTVLQELAPDTEEYRWACAWWAGPLRADTIYEAGVMPDFIGHVCDGVAEQLRERGATVVQTVIEMGTFDNDAVIKALLIDRWLRFECDDRSSPDAVSLRTKMMEWLSPSLPDWQRKICRDSLPFYERSIQGLANWN